MASFTEDSITKTISIALTNTEILVFEDQFIGGPLEGIESALSQNIRQRIKSLTTEAINSALSAGTALSFVDSDDLIIQHTSKPGYKNAAARKAEADAMNG